ncbi:MULTISPECIES: M48 family metalloprotease [Maribacter]|uniref:M48 family metalloprotease n=1 Tax=Maribacter flavus TaxID=1658664 RepID=A0ABU7IE25_9FLAO|nr:MULTISPECIES: M48 family metalloprotease [Maribacter]MDC6404051.1 hypothetical protein [Maribacter sp. PR66]MEE1971192.1 M48 family metalloprotease [Maribacter flavus]
MKYLTLLLFLWFYQSAVGQGFQQDIVYEEVDENCFGNQSYQADPEAEAIVDEIMAQMGLNRTFKIRQCPNIQNALASIQEDNSGKKDPYILYDPIWLSKMKNSSRTDWASIGVLAHEVGHLLNYHSLNNVGSNHRYEISADRFAGSTMARMGSTLEEAQSMFKNYPEKASSTHPGRAERLEAIKEGWNRINNPTQRTVLLNENTPDRDILPEHIINRYYKSVGGQKELGQIRELKFSEKITEKIGQSLNAVSNEFEHEYVLNPNIILVNKPLEGRDYSENYKVENDSLLWKFSDKEKWNQGAPRIGTEKQDDYEFKKDIEPSLSNFFEDFVLLSNPEVATYDGRERIDGIECFELKLPEERLEFGDLQKKGKRVTVEKSYYYQTATGLLYAIVEKELIESFKKGNPKDKENNERKIIYGNYKDFQGLLFPTEITASLVPLKSDIPQTEEGRYQERKIMDIQF